MKSHAVREHLSPIVNRREEASKNPSLGYGQLHAFVQDVNVAPSSIAPAQPPAGTSLQGAQIAPDHATQDSFADAMQTAQPKDASQSNPSPAAVPQHATDLEAASKASLPQQRLKNNAPTPQGAPFAPIVAEDASLTAIHAASLGSGAGHDGSCVPPPYLPGAQQAPSVVSAPAQEAIQTSALEPEADPVERSHAATGNIVDTPVAFASAASCPHAVTPALDASVADTTLPDAPVVDPDAGNAPIGDPSVADETAPAAPLTGKKSGTKSLEASAGTPVKKTLQAHATSFQGSATQPATTVSHTAQVTSGAALPVTAPPQPNAPDLPEQHGPDAASVPIAVKPNAQAVPFAYATQTAKHPAAAPHDVQSASAAQPVVSAAPLSADVSIACDSAPTGATADLALQPVPGEERPGALSARSVFSEAIPAAPHATEPAAVFAPTLITQAAHADAHRAAAAASSVPALNAAGSVTEGAMVQAVPVRRLEVAVDDPVLGNMDVRAEMRAGVLHASLMGAQESAAVMPALHQFLQQHDVNVHTLTFATAADAVAPSGSALSAGNGMGRDTAGALAGGAGSGSQQQQGGGTHPQGERSTGAHTVYTGTAPATYMAPRPGMTATNMMPIGSTLSIHI